MNINFSKSKRFTAAMLCTLVVGLFVAYGCVKPEPPTGGVKEPVIPPVKVCDVLNPLTDLPWLEKMLRAVSVNPMYPPVGWIYQCNYNDTVGFLLVTGQFYQFALCDCEGKNLCSAGCFSSCKDFDIDLNSRKLLWVHPKLCSFDNPLTDIDWLKEYVEDCPEKCKSTVKIYQCNYLDGVGFIFDYPDLGYYDLWNIVGDFVWSSSSTTPLYYELGIDHKSKKLIWEYIKK